MPVKAFVGLSVFFVLLWLNVVVDSLATQAARIFFELGSMDAAEWFARFYAHQYGIRPRQTDSLMGIPLHVFAHANTLHLASNSIPLLALGGLIAFRGAGILLGVSVFATLFAGAGVWLIGRDGAHIGASGLVFGYFGYLATCGFFERRLMRKVLYIVVAIVVVVLYGSLLWGALPTNRFISWEGHLIGLIGGVACAWLFSRVDDPEESDEDDKFSQAYERW